MRVQCSAGTPQSGDVVGERSCEVAGGASARLVPGTGRWGPEGRPESGAQTWWGEEHKVKLEREEQAQARADHTMEGFLGHH